MARRARRNNNTANYNRKDNRDYVAIVSKNKLVGIWTGDENTSEFKPAPGERDTRLGALELFDKVLDRIPTNDELLDKQVAVYALNCLYDCFTKPGDVMRSDAVSDEAKAMIPELAQKYFDRSYNCFLVSESGSNATIVNDGFNWLQEIAERATASAFGVEYSKPEVKTAEVAEAHKTPLQKLEDKLSEVNDQLIDADDDDVIAKLESKKARIKAMLEEEQARVAGAQAQA